MRRVLITWWNSWGNEWPVSSLPLSELYRSGHKGEHGDHRQQRAAGANPPQSLARRWAVELSEERLDVGSGPKPLNTWSTDVWPMTPDSSRLLAGGSDTLCNSISWFQGPIIFPRSVKCYITRFSETWELISKSLTSGRGLMGLDHDQYSWKGDLIGLWSEQNRFLKLVNVVELNANVTDQGNPNEGMRNRKWKSVVIATTITGARPLLGLEPYGALGCALCRPSVSWHKGILWTCRKGLSALLLGLYQWWLWHSRMQSHKRESVLTLPDPLFVPMMDIVCGCSGPAKGTIHLLRVDSRPLYVCVLTSAVTVWVPFFAPPKGSTCTQIQTSTVKAGSWYYCSVKALASIKHIKEALLSMLQRPCRSHIMTYHCV